MLPPYIPDYTNFKPGDQILYSGPFWDDKEIQAATKALTTGKWLTSGEYVARFQNEFSRMFGVRYSHMVNSGSSANLVMVAALKKYLGWQDGDEIIVSPCGFPTTVAPIVQNVLTPVFADIEYHTLNFDLDQVKVKITSRTKAVFVSPVLGNPPDMDELSVLCRLHGIVLIGDHCDSLGSLWSGELLNKLYYSWSTSFFPAHHISTGQGGMVSSNDGELVKLVQSFVSWGKACYCQGVGNLLPCGTCGKRFSRWLEDEGISTVLDHRYVFPNMGYNLSPLDLQGAIGIEQLKKFSEIETKRRANFHTIAKFFEGHPSVRIAKSHLQSDPSWFGVPIICDSPESKENLVKHLENNRIQVRDYFAANLLRHKGYKHLDNADNYPNSDRAFRQVFFMGCPPHYTPNVLQYIGEVVSKWRM